MTDKRENFYILLELSYDPPVVDPDIIQEAIDKKVVQWNKDSRVYSLQQKAQENRDLLPEIMDVMFDESAREREAEEAKKIVEKQSADAQAASQKKLDKVLQLIQTNVPITESLIRRIAININEPYEKVRAMIPENLIQDELVAQVSKREKRKLLDSYEFGKIQKLLNELQTEPAIGNIPTLYDFLNQPESTAREAVFLYAENQLNEITRKNPKNIYNYEAKKELYVYATLYFKEQESYEKYNNSVLNERFQETIRIWEILGEIKIGEESKRWIIDAMIDQGIKQNHAEEMLEDYCEERSIVLEKMHTHTVTGQRCEDCGHYNLDDAKFCEICSSPLEMECINCKVMSKVSVKACRNCNTSFKDMRTFEDLMGLIETALKGKRIREASTYTVKAKALFNTPELKTFNRKIHDVNNKVATIRTECEKLLNDKYIYTAQEKLKTAITLAVDNQHVEALSNKIEAKIQELETLYQNAQQAPENEIPAILTNIKEKAHDAPWLDTILTKVPPKGASYSKTEVIDGKVYLHWTAPEKGDLTYKIYRTPGPLDPMVEGELVCETSGLSYVDESLPLNSPHCYYLYTFRGDLQGKDKPAEKLIGVMQEIEDLAYIYEEGTVYLQWKGIEGKDVVIVRKKGGVPQSPDDGEEIFKGQIELFADNSVEEGAMYGYKIMLQSIFNDFYVYSDGVDVEVSTNAIPYYKEIEVVKSKGTMQLVLMEPFTGVMNLYVSEQPFSYQGFELCTRDTLAALKPFFWQSMTGPLEQVDLTPLSEGRYVLPILTVGDTGRICKPLYVIDVKPIENEKIERFNDCYKMTFSVPAGAQRIEILYSNEPLEHKKNYQTLNIAVEDFSPEEGVILQTSNTEPVYVITRCSNFVLGELSYSDVKSSFYFEENTYTLYYRIESMSSMLGIISRPYFAITIPDDIPYIPAMSLVSAPSSYPISAAQGQLVAKIEKSTRSTFNGLNPNFKLVGNKILYDLKELANKNHYYALFLSFEEEVALFHLNKIASTKL